MNTKAVTMALAVASVVAVFAATPFAQVQAFPFGFHHFGFGFHSFGFFHRPFFGYGWGFPGYGWGGNGFNTCGCNGW